jgi:hypothetical protein
MVQGDGEHEPEQAGANAGLTGEAAAATEAQAAARATKVAMNFMFVLCGVCQKCRCGQLCEE